MKTYLGEKGLKKTWQKNFTKETPCHKCGGNARIMFVAHEEKEKDYVCNLRRNGGKGNYWVHDAIACAVYLCEDCFEATAEINQA